MKEFELLFSITPNTPPFTALNFRLDANDHWHYNLGALTSFLYSNRATREQVFAIALNQTWVEDTILAWYILWKKLTGQTNPYAERAFTRVPEIEEAQGHN